MTESPSNALDSSEDRRTRDAKLVRQVQDGKLEAFRALVETYIRPVRAFVAMRMSTPIAHLIEEVAQDAFVVAFKKIDAFEPGTSFRAWIKAIAWHSLRRELQRQGADKVNREKLADHVSVLCDGNLAAEGSIDDRVDYLQLCLRKLPPQPRRLLQLKYHLGFSTTEIARDLGNSADWVRTNLYRTRNQLRDCIQQHIENRKKGPES